MTTALIKKSKDGKYEFFQCKGHADYAKPGEKDIVCAAISVLVIHTINAIEQLTSDANHMIVTTEEEKGLIQCRFKQELSAEATLLMKSLELGLQSIEQQYSNKYFELKFEEV